jgi:hypothetical protein
MSNTIRFFIIFIFFILSASSIFAQLKVKTIANPDTVCYGTDKKVIMVCTPIGGTPPYKFYWNNGVTVDTNQVIPPNTNKRYIVSVTDADNNKIVDTVTVYASPAPTMTVPNNISICIGTEKLIELNGSVGATVNWQNNNITIGLPETGKDSIKFTPKIIGKTTIFVTPSTSSVCIGTKSKFDITILPLPIAKLPKDTSIVKGDTVTITASGGNTYAWNTIPFQNTPSISVVPSKTTSYTVTVTSAAGCTASNTTKVFVDTKLSIGNIKSSINNISSQKVCEQGTAKISLEATPKGGNNTYKYLWSNSTDSIQTKINDFIQPLQAGVYTYIVTITSGTQKDTASIKINVLKRPQPVILTQQVNPCVGEKVFYQAVDSSKLANVTYTWEIEDSLTSNIMAWDGMKYSKIKKGNPLWVEWSKTANATIKVMATGESCSANSQTFIPTISTNPVIADKGIGFIKTNTIFYYKDSTAKCYQWGYLDGKGFTKIDKETFQAFAPGKSYDPLKLYAVEICATNGCPLISVYRENDNGATATNTKENIVLFPNPNSGDFFLKAENLPEESYELKFVNILGKELYKEQISAPNGKFFKTIKDTNFTSGIYFAVLSSHTKRYKTIKFIVQ